MPEDSPSIYTIMAERVARAILGKINALIGSHNTNTQAHQDIREDIPSYTSDLNNDSGFITISSVPSASSATPLSDTQNGGVGTGTTWARSDHTHPKSNIYAEASHTHPQYLTSHQDITGKEDKSNKVTSLSSSSTDTQYPSAKAVYDATFNLDTLDCINENFTLLSLPQITLTHNQRSFNGEETRLLTNYSEGAYVDWGDGTPIETYADNGTFEHDYLDNMQEHTIIIYGDILNDDLYPYSFYNLTGMTSINIPSSVTSLGESCFRGCAGLTSVTIPNGVTSLGNYCFKDCTSLTNITIPSSVTYIQSNCFDSCSSLTNVTIPSGVTSLGDFCFFGCTGLTSVTIPSSVISLGSSCFRFCTNLVDYQLYWETPPISWDSSLMPNNTDTYFTIPSGTAANYAAKSFPTEKLVERSE